VKAALPRHKGLRFSFTLPTNAGSDAAAQGLNRLGVRVLRAMKRHGLQSASQVVINLMVMNYGDGSPRLCVVKAEHGEPRCDMGASAAQAARNLHRSQGWPLGRIAVIAMPGVNDVRLNVTTLDDARRIGADARALGLAGVMHWSLDRDRPCPNPPPEGASPLCSGLPQAPLDFAAAFRKGSGQ
jgi:chitinase